MAALESDNYSVNIESLDNEPAIRTTNNHPVQNGAAVSGASFRKSSGRVLPVPNGDATQSETPASEENHLKAKSNTKRTILVLVQVLILLLISGLLGASLIIRVLKNINLGGLEVWKWCLFAMSVLCGFALVLWVYWPLMFLVEKAFALNQQVIYFVYGLRKSGAFFIWWLWVMLMWLILMEQRIQKASPRATKVLQITTRTIISLAAASFAWVLLTIALRLLSVKCRFNRYIERVKDVAFHLDVLRRLAGKPIGDGNEGMACCFARKDDDASMADNEFIRIYTFKSEKLNILNWDYIFDNANQDMELSTLQGVSKITTDDDGSKQASIIYDNVVKNRRPKSECITVGDLSRFLDNKDTIKLLLKLFDSNGSRGINRIEFTDWVIKVYNDRKTLLQALNDNKTATKQLNVMLRAVLVIMSITAWLLWIDVLTTKLLAAFLTGVAGGIFIFGESVKTTFQSIIFVFVIHPFDIGDKCIIENIPMEVEQMYILTTVFLNANNEKTYYPNHVLSGKAISNTTRSSILNDPVPFYIDMATSMEKIATLKEHINRKFENSSLVVEGFDSQGNIKMVLKLSPINNVQEKAGETPANRKTEVIFQLMQILQDDAINIKYTFPPTEVVNVPLSAAKQNMMPPRPYIPGPSNHPHST